MTKLVDVTFEAASQTGVTFAAASGGTAQRSAGGEAGLASAWRASLVTNSTTNATANVSIDLATAATVGLGRSVGGTVRVGSFAPDAGNVTAAAILTLRGGSSVFLAGVALSGTEPGNPVVVRYNTNSGIVETVLSSQALKDGTAHLCHLYVLCSSTPGAGRVVYIQDGVTLLDVTYSNNTVSYGSGSNVAQLGITFATPADGFQIALAFDGMYIGDAITAEVSSESGSTISGNTSPIAASTRTLTLTTTAAVPIWSSSDTSVMTISGGVVTLQQAAGGVATISDGNGGSTVVEFLPRTLTYTVGSIAYTAPTLSHNITLTSVSDGYSLYPDIYPSITAPAGVTLVSVDSVGPPWVAYYTVPNAGVYNIVINGATFSVDTANSGGGTVDPPIIIPPGESAPVTAKPIILGVTLSGELVFLF